MRAPSFFLYAPHAKLGLALALGLIFSTVLVVNPAARDAQGAQRAWENLWSGQDASASVAPHEPLVSISAGAKYYAISKNAQGKEDIVFDSKVTSFIETSQARAELFVATLEGTPAHAKACVGNLDKPVCQKLNSIMTDAVTSLDQADLAIESYQKKGIVADPVLARLQTQVKYLRDVSARYPGIGPKMEP